jgi:hypothetical protein
MIIKKKDIRKILCHEPKALRALRTIEQCRETLIDSIWMASDAILKADEEIVKLRIENKKLKKKLKQYE